MTKLVQATERITINERLHSRQSENTEQTQRNGANEIIKMNGG